MPSLLTPIQSLKGIGPALAKKFTALGLTTLEDALFYFPIRHEDWRTRVAIRDISAGTDVTISGELIGLRTRHAFRRRRLSVTEGRLDDGTAVLPVVWFNQPYLQQALKVGERLFVSGRVESRGEVLQMTNPAFERVSGDPLHQRLVPIYSTVDGLSQRQIRSVMKTAVELVNLVPDHLPADILESTQVVPKHVALQEIHFPTSPATAAAAVRRLQFDELLVWQLRWQDETAHYRQYGAPPFPFNETSIRSFVQSLPFELTTDQRQAAWEILQELGRPEPMSRLLQGDVGSGKTVVAAIAAHSVCRQGGQVAVLVPTVVLAQQHFQTFSRVFQGTETAVALLTGDQAEVNTQHATLTRRALLTAVRDGAIQILIGTHAMLEQSVPWKQLGLVVVDEQQRFGVAQRDALLDVARRAGQPAPHFLSLTATPIPRTLALFLAGELAISRLKAKPPGRTPITTVVVAGAERDTIDQEIEATVADSHQAFYITPLIEESDHFGAHAATVEFERLRETHPRLRVGLLHGSMPAADRVAVMQEFWSHEIDLLVSTTVIEVGIDIPNATLMIIDGADRFGLAQLHQLRGRVGRGSAPSRCLLVTDRTDQATKSRLERVATTDDGLELAELDLQERGSGELYGLRQSGLPDWHLATLQDTELLTQTREAAQLLRSRGEEKAILMDEEWKAPAGTRHRE